MEASPAPPWVPCNALASSALLNHLLFCVCRYMLGHYVAAIPQVFTLDVPDSDSPQKNVQWDMDGQRGFLVCPHVFLQEQPYVKGLWYL